MKIIFLWLMSITVAVAQVALTKIGDHQIGETLEQWHQAEPSEPTSTAQQNPIAPHNVGELFAEWLTLNQLNLTDICGKHKRGDNAMDYKAVCKRLSAIQDTGQGDFYTTDQMSRNIGWRFVGGKLADYFMDGIWRNEIDQITRAASEAHADELVTRRNARSYTWKFSNGKLSEVAVTPDWAAIYKQYNEEGIARHPEVVPRFDDEVRLLTQTYATPSKVESVPYQNAYGAHWERSRVQWTEPDGTLIVAFERTGFDQQGQL